MYKIHSHKISVYTHTWMYLYITILHIIYMTWSIIYIYIYMIFNGGIVLVLPCVLCVILILLCPWSLIQSSFFLPPSSLYLWRPLPTLDWGAVGQLSQARESLFGESDLNLFITGQCEHSETSLGIEKYIYIYINLH